MQGSNGIDVGEDVARITGVVLELGEGAGEELLVGGKGSVFAEGQADMADVLA